VNGIQPGFVSDTPSGWTSQRRWSSGAPALPPAILATMKDIVHAVQFLMENPAVNGLNLTSMGLAAPLRG
jgi:hypothetical protein